MEELLLERKYYNCLNTDAFARMLDDPTQCYKFYWLESLLNLVIQGDDEPSFNTIINQMICSAWYSVVNYHLRLGPTVNGKTVNFLEHAIKVINNSTKITSNYKKEDIIKAIKDNEDLIRKDKINISYNVPYRLLSSFLDEIGGNDSLWDNKAKLIQYLNNVNSRTTLPYTIVNGRGLEKRVKIDSNWKELITDNYPIISSWIQNKKIRFLQDRNPGVPGIVYKIEPENQNRKLGKVRQLYKLYISLSNEPVIDIYNGSKLGLTFDIDHFIPWSYIANDEIWNLTPTDNITNIKKGNQLPDWNKYFYLFANNQYQLYRNVCSNELIRNEFEKCRKDNINSVWANDLLFLDGITKEIFCNVLQENIKPIYESAKLQGFKIWNN